MGAVESLQKLQGYIENRALIVDDEDASVFSASLNRESLHSVERMNADSRISILESRCLSRCNPCNNVTL